VDGSGGRECGRKVRECGSGVVSGTTVRALVLGRLSQKILIELKDNAKEINKKIFHALAIWTADVCCRAARQLICIRAYRPKA